MFWDFTKRGMYFWDRFFFKEMEQKQGVRNVITRQPAFQVIRFRVNDLKLSDNYSKQSDIKQSHHITQLSYKGNAILGAQNNYTSDKGSQKFRYQTRDRLLM